MTAISNKIHQISDFLFAKRQFDTAFLWLIGLTYFMQGFRNYAFGDGIIWFYSSAFGLDPGPTQVYLSAVSVTWNIKMAYGLIFDNFPIYKRHDKPYMIMSSVISVFGFAGLRFEMFSDTPFKTALCFWFALMGMAMSDVIADAMVVKHARDAGQVGGASLQTFCWVMMSVGSIFGRPIAGWINNEDGSGSRDLLGTLYALTACLNVISSFWITEQKSHVHWSLSRLFLQLIRLFKSIFYNRTVLVPAMWIVLSAAVVPDTTAAMNFWKKDVIDIGAQSQAYIDAFGDVFSIIGLLLYNTYFKETSYRKIFFLTQLLATLFAFSDVILVYRWNIAFNIPDTLFLVGSQTMVNTIYSLQQMPFLVMAAQLCPKDIEATFYAAMMSLSNTGGSISSLWGGYLLSSLHIAKISDASASSATMIPGNAGTGRSSETYDFTMLPVALWVRVSMMAVPAFLVFCMIPDTAVINDLSDNPGNERGEFVELGNVHDDDDDDDDDGEDEDSR